MVIDEYSSNLLCGVPLANSIPKPKSPSRPKTVRLRSGPHLRQPHYERRLWQHLPLRFDRYRAILFFRYFEQLSNSSSAIDRATYFLATAKGDIRKNTSFS